MIDEQEGERRDEDEVERDDPGRTPGGTEPMTGGRPSDESQNADIPAGA